MYAIVTEYSSMITYKGIVFLSPFLLRQCPWASGIPCIAAAMSIWQTLYTAVFASPATAVLIEIYIGLARTVYIRRI